MPLVNAYATVAELGAKMGLDADKITRHTALMESSLNNASRFIDLKTSTFFYQTTVTNELIDVTSRSNNGFYISPGCLCIVAPCPIITVSALSQSGTALSEKTSYAGSGDFVVKKSEGLIIKPNGTWSTSSLAIDLTADIGYATPPLEVNELCLNIASVYTRLDNKIVTDETGDIEGILSSQIPSWVFKSLKKLARPIV